MINLRGGAIDPPPLGGLGLKTFVEK